MFKILSLGMAAVAAQPAPANTTGYMH
jgi:hypothetical protein